MTVKEAENREAWLKARELGIGGSDAAIIAGFNPWKSRYELWLEKTGLKEAEDLSDNEAVEWGTKLEALVAEKFCEVTGKKVQRKGMLQDPEIPFFLANVDRVVVGENAGLECKTANAFKAKEWDNDQIPDAYYLQCQWYCSITGADRWYIACLIGGSHFVWKTIERNEQDIAELRKDCLEFWQMVESKTAPDVDGSEGCSNHLKTIKANKGAEIALPSTAEKIIENLMDVKNTIKTFEEQKAMLENKLKAMLDVAEIGTTPKYKVTWKTQAGRVSVDTKKLKAEYPEAYAACQKVGADFRKFDVK